MASSIFVVWRVWHGHNFLANSRQAAVDLLDSNLDSLQAYGGGNADALQNMAGSDDQSDGIKPETESSRINKGGQKRDYAEDAAADSNGNAETREENGEEIAPAPGPLSFFDAIAGAMKHDDDAFAMTPDARDAAEERQRKRDLQDPLNLAWAAVYAAGAGTTDPDAPIAPEDELIRGTVGAAKAAVKAAHLAAADKDDPVAAAADAVLKAMERVAEEPVADHNDIIGEAERVAQASTANTGDSPDGYAIAAVQDAVARAAGAGGGLEIRNGAANSAVVQAASIVRRAAAARAANPGRLKLESNSDALAPGSQLRKGNDCVLVTFSAIGRLAIVKANRAWRKPLGIRAVVVTNLNVTDVSPQEAREHNEIWTYWPDMEQGYQQKAWYKGDQRAAMAPFIAHRELKGDYKWLLVGDDDTIFFPEGIARAVLGLDHNMPYYVSDSQAEYDRVYKKPPRTSPRCVPCNYSPDRYYNRHPKRGGPGGVPALRGCPCRPRDICAHWRKHQPHTVAKICGANGEPDWLEPDWTAVHGDPGMLLSVGLMREVDWDEYRACINSFDFPMGGDGLLSRCLWIAGFGITDPGYSWDTADPFVYFTFGRWELSLGQRMIGLFQLIHFKILQWRSTGFCPAGPSAKKLAKQQLCIMPDTGDEFLTSMASTHSSAKMFETFEQAQNAIELVTTAYRAYMDKLYEVYPQVLTLSVEPGVGAWMGPLPATPATAEIAREDGRTSDTGETAAAQDTALLRNKRQQQEQQHSQEQRTQAAAAQDMALPGKDRQQQAQQQKPRQQGQQKQQQQQSDRGWGTL